MTIETRFNKGASVWVMYYNKPTQVRVEGLVFVTGVVSPNLSAGEGERNRMNHIKKDDSVIYTIAFPTAMSDYSGNYFHEPFYEKDVFSTKEELLKSL